MTRSSYLLLLVSNALAWLTAGMMLISAVEEGGSGRSIVGAAAAAAAGAITLALLLRYLPQWDGVSTHTGPAA